MKKTVIFRVVIFVFSLSLLACDSILKSNDLTSTFSQEEREVIQKIDVDINLCSDIKKITEKEFYLIEEGSKSFSDILINRAISYSQKMEIIRYLNSHNFIEESSK